MKICYLLESSGLWGGVKNVFDQARGLQNRGHDVFIRARTGDHGWYPYRLPIDYVDVLSRPFRHPREKPDILIATFWTTVDHAIGLECPRTFHLCQGYEGDFSEYFHLREDIKRAYQAPVPKIVNGPWLKDILERHFKSGAFEIHIAPPIIDTEIFKPRVSKWRELDKDLIMDRRLLIVGNFESSVKAVPDALQAVRILRENGIRVHLIRASGRDTKHKEQSITPIDEFHVCLNPVGMAGLYQKSDLFISSSLSSEGFGLPFAEALACGIPCVVTDIPSYRSFDSVHNYALFVPPGDPQAMADAVIEIMKDQKLQKQFKNKGPLLIQRGYNADKTAERLEKIFFKKKNREN